MTKRRDDTDLAIEGVPIQIKFVGLLYAVSSIMSEEAGELIGMVPYLGMLKTNFKDRPLAIPASVQRCVHFAAAQDLIPGSGSGLRGAWGRPPPCEGDLGTPLTMRYGAFPRKRTTPGDCSKSWIDISSCDGGPSATPSEYAAGTESHRRFVIRI